MKKRISILLAATLLAGLLAACGGGAGSTADTPDQEAPHDTGGAEATEATNSEAGDDGDAITLTWGLWDWDAAPYYEPLIEAYTAQNPHVTIEYIDLGYTDYQTAIATQLAGESNIDIVTIGDTPTYANLSAVGHLEPLDGYIERDGVDLALYNGVPEQLTIDNSLYALPFRNDFWVIYYNKDLFDEAGVDYPSNDMTLEEYEALAAQMTSGTGVDKVYGTHFHTWRSTVQLFGVLDGQNTITGGEYEFLRPHYERVLRMQDEETVMDYGTLKANNTHYSGLFYNNQLAMVHMGIWFAPIIIEKLEIGEALCPNWGMVKFPHPEGVEAGTTLGTITTLGINAKSSQKDEAWDFIRYVTSVEGSNVIAATGSFPGIQTEEIVSTIADKEGYPTDENSREAMMPGTAYLEMPIFEHTGELEVIMNEVHDAVMTYNITVDEAIEQMNEQVAALG